MNGVCRVELLGGLRVRQGRRTVTRFRTHKTGALLAYLSYYRDQMHPRETLTALFWPELSSERAGRNSLSISLSSLRSQLEPPGVPAGTILIADRQNVSMNLSAVTTDVAEFELAVAEAASATSGAEQIERLSQAASLWTGRLLPGYYDAWIGPEQERLDHLFLFVCRKLITAFEGAGDLEKALQHAYRFVAMAPLSEDAYRELIRLLLASGSAHDALRQYRELERVLHEDLGEIPSPQTRALVAPLLALAHDSAAAPSPSRAPRRPSTIVSPLPAKSAPPEAASPFPTGSDDAPEQSHLPLTFTRFFGREDEQMRLGWLLRTPSVRLVTLTGPGGTGKTRLAIEVAQGLRETLNDSVWFAPLADLSDPNLLPGLLADLLGVPRAHAAGPMDGIASALTGRQTLLVLDNFEHLIKGGTTIVEELLRRVPALILLVTSRQRLLLDAEQEFPLLPFSVPRVCAGEHRDDPEQLLRRCDSVALFVDRAQRARPDFQVTRRNAGAIADLCDRLEGIPLAIELAAARAQVLTPAQMLAQLSRRWDLLVSRRRDLVPRHRSLWTAIEWSYRLVSPDLQRFFAALSVFRGGWTFEAAEAVTGEPLALDYLAQLCECSLVLAEETNDVVRFSLLETLREFAQEQLEVDEAQELAQRHAEYYLALAEKAEQNRYTGEQRFWLDRLETEHDNLRAVLSWCRTSGSVAIELRLAGTLAFFWRIRGYLSEGRQHLAGALSRSQIGQPTPAQARVMLEAAILALNQDDTPLAHTLVEESLTLWRSWGDSQGIARCLHTLGNLYRGQRRCEEARSCYLQALAISRSTGDRVQETSTVYELGNLAYDAAEWEAARFHYEQALALCGLSGNQVVEACCLTNLGHVAMIEGDTQKARVLTEQGWELHRALGSQVAETYALQNLGDIAEKEGDLARASSFHTQALKMRFRLGQKMEIVFSFFALAGLAMARGDVEPMVRLCGAADALCERYDIRFLPPHNERRIRGLAAARTALGEDAYTRAWAGGRAMTLEQAVQFALENGAAQ